MSEIGNTRISSAKEWTEQALKNGVAARFDDYKTLVSEKVHADPEKTRKEVLDVLGTELDTKLTEHVDSLDISIEDKIRIMDLHLDIMVVESLECLECIADELNYCYGLKVFNFPMDETTGR